MATAEMITKLASELVRALEVTMDPTAVHAHRQEAYTAYEQFKVSAVHVKLDIPDIRSFYDVLACNSLTSIISAVSSLVSRRSLGNP